MPRTYIYNCARCGKGTDNRLNSYRIQARGLRRDSNKTAGKARASKELCEGCVVVVLERLEEVMSDDGLYSSYPHH